MGKNFVDLKKGRVNRKTKKNRDTMNLLFPEKISLTTSEDNFIIICSFGYFNRTGVSPVNLKLLPFKYQRQSLSLKKHGIQRYEKHCAHCQGNHKTDNS